MNQQKLLFAADDAISQAKHAVAINKHLGGILF